MGAVVTRIPPPLARPRYRPRTPIVVKLNATRRHIVIDLVRLRPARELGKTKADPWDMGKGRLDGPLFALLAASPRAFSLKALR